MQNGNATATPTMRTTMRTTIRSTMQSAMRSTTRPGAGSRPRQIRTGRLIAVAAGCVLLAACAGKEPKSAVQDLQEAYNLAQRSVERGNYRRGIEVFEAIQARYPFSDLSRQIQLELMYAYYKSGSKELAVETADTFMRENPIHHRVDYAMYIKGLSYFEGGPGMLERLFRKDVGRRPPKDVELAYTTLRRLVDRYPASEYAPDARQRLLFLKNRLADYENHVADFYIRRGAYVASLRRAQRALEEYNGAPGNARSLELIIESYERMGMNELAADSRRVLEKNFPERIRQRNRGLANAPVPAESDTRT